MTRKAILELIQGRCKKLDETKQFGLQYIQGYCDQVWQEFVISTFQSPDVESTFYSKEYTLAVSGDVTNGYYSVLPEEIINIPIVGSGVVSVRNTNVFTYLEPITEGDYRHITSQEVYRQNDDAYYYVDYSTIYYGGNLVGIINAGVKVRLVIPFSKYLISENIPLPSSKDMMFIDAVVERIIGTPPVDLTNKNSDM